ncbi:MAG: hemolysin III family protein [Christensenellales bacterium]
MMNTFLYGDEDYLIKQKYFRYGLVYYTAAEEALNSLSHALGGVLGIAVLIVFYLLSDSVVDKVAAIISGLFIALPYVNSAIYHGLTDLKMKAVWRRIDHSSICFIIIGCATPMVLCLSQTAYNFAAMGIAIAVCLINITGCGISLKRFSKIALCLDFVVAFLFTAAYIMLKDIIPKGARICYVTGAAVCLLAMIAYAVRKRYAHTIFHFMMLFGTAIFFVAGYIIYCAA